MGEIPKIKLELTSTPIKATTRRLKHRWKVDPRKANIYEDQTGDLPVRFVYTDRRYRKYELREGHWVWVESGKMPFVHDNSLTRAIVKVIEQEVDREKR